MLLPTTAAAVGVSTLAPSAADVPGLPAFHCWAPLQLRAVGEYCPSLEHTDA